MIKVNVSSEIGTLKSVILCYANPFKMHATEILQVFQPSVLFQGLRNSFRPYDYKILRTQQEGFIQILEENGVKVLLADNMTEIVPQHYTRDIGFAIDDLFIKAKMGTPIRDNEYLGIKKYTDQFSKYEIIEKGRIEGGDVMLYKDRVLVGLGEGTNIEGIENLKEILLKNNNKREVIPIHFNQRGIIHLDTKFNIVGENVAIFNPNCFEKKSLQWFENHFDLIEATKKETNQICINTFSISPTKVVMKQGSERLGNLISDKGITPIFVKYDEVTKLPGSLRCTTCPVERVDLN